MLKWAAPIQRNFCSADIWIELAKLQFNGQPRFGEPVARQL
jgi:hypothetical protein